MTVRIDIKKYSDAELILKFKDSHDNAIIGELFQRYCHLVFGVCMKYLKDEDEAKDGVMKIFEKILTDLHRHNIDNFKGWLYMVAKNHCLMYFRSKKNHVELPKDLTEDFDNAVSIMESGLEAELPVESATIVHHNGEDKEQQFVLMESALQRLNQKQKICIELFYLQEKSYEEVAAITGYSMKEVKSYIQNGKRNLKIIMTTGRPEAKR